MDYPKSVAGVGLVNGKFIDENEQTGQQGSLIPSAWGNDVTDEILAVQAAGGQEPDETKTNQLLLAIQKLIEQSAGVLAYSVANLPTEDVGPILVSEVAEVWRWSSSAYFTGYRSPLCGRPMDGHTIAPLASEVSAVGGVLNKTAYAALWGFAQENGLVVTQAVWTANIGAFYFVDVDATSFRVPDLRNIFRRYTGTDADTANARALGSYKADTLKSHIHGGGVAGLVGGQYSSGGAPTGTGSTGATGTAETAPKHTAFNPVIHI
ncbi:phage tail protein [Herbaspirillum sp. C7C8]|uniref:phage tail protein n=1 Tax=Herbaspirillum sp. C7C8 TaxID=2736665 RepID=UPI001F524633|nr:phage tail protein [Herbaspirillum sp. C7C8]MCI1005050.1 phage tail protein [Herbaspirillum sp. C7C8]